MEDAPALDKRQTNIEVQGYPPSVSEVEKRKLKISQQLERLRDGLTNKVRRNYKSDHLYRREKKRSMELIYELESELSALNCPGEYYELPVALVADELGLSYKQLKDLISIGEVEASGKPAHERISRKELERVIAFGVSELIRASKQTAAVIFDQAIPFVQNGELDHAERAYRRMNARESWQGVHAPAYLIALELLKGDLEDVLSCLRCVCEEIEPLRRTAVFARLSTLLQKINLEEHGVRILCEQILKISEAGFKEYSPYNKSRLKQPSGTSIRLKRKS